MNIDKIEKERLELRLESLKDISESYSMKDCLEDLEEVTEILDREEQEGAIKKIEEVERKVREKVLEEKKDKK